MILPNLAALLDLSHAEHEPLITFARRVQGASCCW
jgi:hypothetical protein